jgi:CTP:molybdopterin cytidylyltransferase MocA
MFRSVQLAAQWRGWRREYSHLAISLVDQPQIPVSTLRDLLAFARAHHASICQPSRGGRPKHPVIFPRPAAAALAGLARTSKEPQDTEEAGSSLASTPRFFPTLRDFLAQTQIPRDLMESADRALDIDLDTPDQYRAALKGWTCREMR